MKTNILILFLLVFNFSFAQHIIILDTTNSKFRTDLEKLYAERNQQTLNSFKVNEDKSIRKNCIDNYTELNKEFKLKIKKGTFINDTFYSTYLNNLLQQIVENNPEYDQIKNTTLLLAFSENPNAYAIGDDVVVLELPLITKLKSEHELAFIICHEISHNLLKHSYKSIVKRAKYAKSDVLKKQIKTVKKTKFGKGAMASNFLKETVYSNRKENRFKEHEADSLGTILFKNSFKDNHGIVLQTLKTLETLDVATDSLVTDDYKRLFTTSNQPFNDQWINTEEFSKYKYDKTSKFWNVDSLRTHPDALVRANYIEDKFKIKETEFKIIDNQKFNELKTQAKYHYVLGLFALENYGESLYESLILLKNDENNAYVKNIVKENLIKIIDAKQRYEFNKYVDTPNFKSYSNSYNTFLTFIRELRINELKEILRHYTT